METDPVYQKSENGMQRLYEKLDQTFFKRKKSPGKNANKSEISLIFAVGKLHSPPHNNRLRKCRGNCIIKSC